MDKSFEYAIEIRGLTKKYRDVVAVDHLNLNIRQGELFALLGVNGAGKTTTIKMLSCLTKPDEGDALLCGKSILRESAQIKKFLAVSPQETAVAPNLSVRENLMLMAGLHGFSKADSIRKTAEISEQLELNPILDKGAKKLSGGWQRRLSIGMALISDPKILFLDEPTLGLDVIARSELWDFIRSLKGSVTIILTTHYMEEAESLSDRVGIMRNGRLLTVGTPNDIRNATGCDKFEDAFIRIVKQSGNCRP
ncbi:MAG: ABC transporter ATP-binding protein [Eubacteriales bacterium]